MVDSAVAAVAALQSVPRVVALLVVCGMLCKAHAVLLVAWWQPALAVNPQQSQNRSFTRSVLPVCFCVSGTACFLPASTSLQRYACIAELT